MPSTARASLAAASTPAAARRAARCRCLRLARCWSRLIWLLHWMWQISHWNWLVSSGSGGGGGGPVALLRAPSMPICCGALYVPCQLPGPACAAGAYTPMPPPGCIMPGCRYCMPGVAANGGCHCSDLVAGHVPIWPGICIPLKPM
eukprot:217760-Chlamydomonas_euryale.AAC.5